MRLQGRLVVATLVLLGVMAPPAGATLRFENHNNPAGDPTVISYRLDGPADFGPPELFQLVDNDYKSFGVKAGTYTATALLPPGWEVEAIQCFGGPASSFAIDVPNARVTVTHDSMDHHSCAFTNRRIPRNGSSPPSPGIAPSLGPNELAQVDVPRRPALVGVVAGRRYAEATVRITRQSIIKGRLLSRRGKILGSARMTRKAGTHVLRVSLKPRRAQRMRRRGLKQVTLTLRVAVTAQSGGATHVFTHLVLVKL
jgi:hypothetical protein